LQPLEYSGDFIVFQQRELSGQHFFEGKARIFDLEPFSPEELVTYYKKMFGSSKPFSEEALLQIAKLSRGVMRRFKRYVGLCTEESDSVSIADVNRIIDKTQLTKDLDFELRAYFPNEGVKRSALRLYSEAAGASGLLTQKLLVERLGISEPKVARVALELEVQGYLKRKNTSMGKLVSIV
jgi:hypothetical protein